MAIADTAILSVLLRLQNELGPGLAAADAQLTAVGDSSALAAGGVAKSGVAMDAAAVSAGGLGLKTAETEAKVGLLSRTSTGAGQALDHFKGTIGGVVSSVGLLGGTIGLFAGAAGIGAAVKASLDFQQQMELIRTQAGATQAEVTNMSTALLGLAASVGTSATDLSMGLFHIESVGLRGAQALDVLKTAAEGAKVGNANLEDVVNALTGAVISGIPGVQNITSAMGTMNAIVGAGNLRMQQLTAAFGTGILVAARAAGLSITDVGAALDTFTAAGQPAQRSATRLQTLFALMQAPSTAAVKSLQSIGITSLQLGADLHKPNGLLTAVDDVRAHLIKLGELNPLTNKLTPQGSATILDAFGKSRFGTTMETLILDAQTLADKYKAIGAAANQFGTDWAATQQTAAEHFADFQAAIGSLAIGLGNVLLPAFSSVAQSAAHFLSTNETGIIGGLNTAAATAQLFGNALEAVAGPLGSLVGLLSKVPGAGTLGELLLGGAIAGKASSMLFGKNPFTFAIGQLTSALGFGGNKGGAASGLGGVVQSAEGIRVFVTNMGVGGLGGGAAAAGEGTAVAEGGAAAETGVFAGSVPAIIPAAIVAAGALGVYKEIMDMTDFTAQRTALESKYGLTNAQALALQVQQHGGMQSYDLRTRTGMLPAFSNVGTTYAQALAQAMLIVQRQGGAGAFAGPAGAPVGSFGHDMPLSQQQSTLKAAVIDANRSTGLALSRDIVDSKNAVTRQENEVAQNIKSGLGILTNIEQGGFSAVVAAVSGITNAIAGLPGYFGTAAAQGRGTGPGGRPVTTVTSDPGRNTRAGFTILVKGSARVSDAVTATQSRMGPTAVRAGAMVAGT